MPLTRRLFRAVALALAIVVLLALAGAAFVKQPGRGPIGDRPVHAAISPERLRETVTTLAQRYRTRWITHPETLAAVADWLGAELRASGLAVEDQTYTTLEGTFRNVVGVRTGREPAAPVVVIGAHYDAYGELPGADDNASGVAALVELARTLPAGPPERTVQFVAFANEEPPLFAGEDMGSLRYARHLADTGTPVALMLSLEMVGCFDDAPGSQRFPLAALRPLYPSRGDFIAVVGDAASGRAIRRVRGAMRSTGALPVQSFRGPAWIPGIDWSDHRSFRQLGWDAVMVTDTAFLRNPRYHTRDDMPDTLDYVRMAAVVRALHGVLYDVAGWPREDR